MKTNIGVFFGGRSTEHEISVISASQAMHAINREKYMLIPYIFPNKGNITLAMLFSKSLTIVISHPFLPNVPKFI